jgi:hypothetical protein
VTCGPVGRPSSRQQEARRHGPLPAIRQSGRRASRMLLLGSFVPFPYQPSDHGFARKVSARLRRRLDKQLAVLNPPMAPLLRAVPGFVPRNVDGSHEVLSLDSVLTAVGDHRLVKFRPFRVAGPCFANFGGNDCDHAPLAREDQNPFRSRAVHAACRCPRCLGTR